MTTSKTQIRIAIDRGGTFTDVYAERGTETHLIKLLSEDPQSYSDAPTEGIRRILEHFRKSSVPRGQLLDLDDVESIRMGTTVATNALLERKGDRVALLVTKGFKDILEIGQQSRPDIFDLSATKLKPLYEDVYEIDERLVLAQWGAGRDKPANHSSSKQGFKVVEGLSGENLLVEQPLDLTQVNQILKEVKAKGFNSIAVALLHAYLWPDHELAIAEAARAMGFGQVSVSSEVQSMVKIVARGHSAVADAYLNPTTARYISQLAKGFRGGLEAVGHKLLFMQSDGGLAFWDKFSGLRAILSGPAGGVVGYARTSLADGVESPVLGFDMGGTSTDVSRYQGEFEHVYETTIAQINIQAPQLDIQTVAAGGGSILSWKNGLFNVGPESAGAHPGPACYRKGGPLTVTDANLCLGRIDPSTFPAIFGPNEDQPLDTEIVRVKFEEITRKINADRGTQEEPFTIEDVAYGFITVANETMARPIRAMTEGRGHNTYSHTLASFGGAGGQHACELAERLGINNVIVHRNSSVLSAFGIALADIVCDLQQPAACKLVANSVEFAKDIGRLKNLCEEATSLLKQQGHANIEVDKYLSLRYTGSDSLIMIRLPSDFDFSLPQGTLESVQQSFSNEHYARFGFNLDRVVELCDIRARGRAISGSANTDDLRPPSDTASFKLLDTKDSKTAPVYFKNGWQKTTLLQLNNIELNSVVMGPAMILDNTQTILVPPQTKVYISPRHLIMNRADTTTVESKSAAIDNELSQKPDPILLSIFAHRFMSIAEQMGTTLQKTAISTNIKERLDFSCAIFDAKGGLVANAPHIPVHLGSMSSAVAAQIEILGAGVHEGIFVANHPAFGGSHLPDITVMKPVYKNGELQFWVAARGHHSDIGGISAGSMPPFSQHLWQEGAIIKSYEFKSDLKGFEQHLVQEPAQYPGCSGSRSYADSVSDLYAQIAAIEKGIHLLDDLCVEHTMPVVQKYMTAIQENAESSVRGLLKAIANKHGPELFAADFLDDGTKIALSVEIDSNSGDAVFDFSGTGPQVLGNLNAPEAITKSAILYCLRTMIAENIPLNNGCMIPLTIKIPKGSVLSPGPEAAVVGGNVETSQRVCDVIFNALKAVAGSQGTCNNFTFGCSGDEHTQSFGYYETIAGGAGAGPTWNGQSGIQVHMTNTRATDPEVFERRYPVILRQFSLRNNSGGDGKFKGGDGVVREIEFRQPVEASILSERRAREPYGLAGGKPGEMGKNLWVQAASDSEPKKVISIGGKATVKVSAGDRIIIMTPGGGGYGEPESST